MLSLYIQHYIKTVHYWLKYNGLGIVQKTTKLIEGGHRGLQNYRHVITSTFFFTFLRFFKIQKVLTFHVFCRVSYVFSNYASMAKRGRGKYTVNWAIGQAIVIVYHRSWLLAR